MSHILIVDDDEAIRLLLRRMLVRKGYTVEEARNGREAINYLERESFNLVITDLVMLEGNGFEVIDYVRENRSGLNVIAISASTDLDVAIERGAVRARMKPFDMEDLLRDVAEVISSV